MKNKLFLILSLILIMFVLFGCDKASSIYEDYKTYTQPKTATTNNTTNTNTTINSSKKNNTSTKEKEEDIYTYLNKIVNAEYNKYSIGINLSRDGYSLNSSYDVEIADNIKTIEYSYEKLNSFIIKDGEIISPEEPKSTLTGKITVDKNGKVKKDGEEINVDIENITLNEFVIKEEYFDNVTILEDSFNASIINASGFFNKEVTYSNIQICIQFDSTGLKSILLTYTSEQASFITFVLTIK